MAQVHPGVVNSDFLERAKFATEAAAEKMRSTLDTMPGVQQPEDIARAVMEAGSRLFTHQKLSLDFLCFKPLTANERIGLAQSSE